MSKRKRNWDSIRLVLQEEAERLRGEELRLGDLRRLLSDPVLYRGEPLDHWPTRGTATPFIPGEGSVSMGGSAAPFIPRAATGPTTRLTLEHQCPTGDTPPADATFCPHCGARIRP